MPIYQRPSHPHAFGEQQARQQDADRRLGLRETRQLLTVDRGVTANVPSPGEGQLMVEGTKLRHYAQGEWRGGKVVLHIKVVNDLTVVTTSDSFFFVADDDMDGLALTSAHAYVTGRLTNTAPASDINVLISDISTLTTLTSSPIVIDAGDYTSYSSANPAEFLTATVSVGDELSVVVSDEGATDGYGLGVILGFS